MTRLQSAGLSLLIGAESPAQSSVRLTAHQPQAAPLGSFDLSQFMSLAATADLTSLQTGLEPRSKKQNQVPRYSHNDDFPQAGPSLCGVCPV